MFRRLWASLRSASIPALGDDVPLTPEEYLAGVVVSAHGYDLNARFRHSENGEVTLRLIGPFDPAPIVVSLSESFDVAGTFSWACRNIYPLDSGPPTRQGCLELVHAGRRITIRFYRSQEILSPNPVNELIDWCGRFLPILMSTKFVPPAVVPPKKK